MTTNIISVPLEDIILGPVPKQQQQQGAGEREAAPPIPPRNPARLVPRARPVSWSQAGSMVSAYPPAFPNHLKLQSGQWEIIRSQTAHRASESRALSMHTLGYELAAVPAPEPEAEAEAQAGPSHQIDDTVGVMRDNINKVSQRGERLDSLQDKTDNLATSAQGFRRGANRVRKQMWWKDMKMRMCLIGGIIILLLVIIVPAVVTTRKKD